jgi:uncharacterized protein YigE (DUF2233 family)
VGQKVGLLVCLLVGWLVGCGGDTAVTPSIPPTPIITATAVAPTPIPDTGWQPIQPGLEQRTIHLFDAQNIAREQIVLLRLEPDSFSFRVAYRPGAPQSIATWQAETGALLVVNGGFFTETYHATGLVIVEGQASGASYGDFAGMLAIDERGPELRWLGERPYNPDEPLHYALQSFPMLVRPGGQVGFPQEDGVVARRTAVAQDENGRFLFIFAPWGSLSLHAFSRWLVESDLALDIALNLDGGPSTGMLLLPEGRTAVEIPAFSTLPTVITVHPNE